MSALIEGLILGWDRNYDYAKRLTADIAPDRMAFQPAANMNHPAWIFSHLTLYHPALEAVLLGKPFEDPKGHKYGMNSKCLPDGSLYPSKAELMIAFEQGHNAVKQALRTVGAARCEQDTPLERWRATMPKIGVLLPYLMLNHESTHLGQLSMWRRVQGMPSV